MAEIFMSGIWNQTYNNHFVGYSGAQATETVSLEVYVSSAENTSALSAALVSITSKGKPMDAETARLRHPSDKEIIILKHCVRAKTIFAKYILAIKQFGEAKQVTTCNPHFFTMKTTHAVQKSSIK